MAPAFVGWGLRAGPFLALVILAFWVLLTASSPPSSSPLSESKPAKIHVKRDLIYDIGFNTGHDTRYYLKLPGKFSVVAVEADPVLYERGLKAKDLQPYFQNGRLKLIHAVIRGRNDPPGLATFYVNTRQNQWSSFIKEVGCRTGAGLNYDPNPSTKVCKQLKLPTLRCSELLRENVERVYYLKVDIEGKDLDCLLDLDEFPAQSRPTYISLEELRSGAPDWWRPRAPIPANKSTYVEFAQETLANLSYPLFKRIAQHLVQKGPNSGNGPWDSKDMLVGRSWSPFRFAKEFDDLNDGKWYDWHALRAEI